MTGFDNKPIRLLVCGGRTYDELRTLSKEMSANHPIAVVIHGGASGADRLAARWADVNNIQTIVFPANWKQGRKAGPIRNQFMLDESKPDLVLAFPGGPGTADMVPPGKGRWRDSFRSRHPLPHRVKG